MPPVPDAPALTLQVGGDTRAQLLRRLEQADVHLNEHARTLLDDPAFDAPAPQTLHLVQRSVGQLNFPDGATQPQAFAAARQQGLQLCPVVTGPYLRLALTEQRNAPDSVLSAGRPPSGAVHVASPPVSQDVDHPKGFYLRVVDGQAWLRGYRCDDSYVWPADVYLTFALRPSPR